MELRNVKGTCDFLPKEQEVRQKVAQKLQRVFECYGCLPLDTPIVCYYDILSSKYAGGSEILKEVYTLTDQGNRVLGLRYDLTIPFAKVVGMNPGMRMPFKRYEIGKVFRDGPVKTGRLREFVQCDVDIVGVKSQIAEAELMAMAVDAFKELGLDVYISYNNRKLLSGLLLRVGVPEDKSSEVILILDKSQKISRDELQKELKGVGLDREIIDSIIIALERTSDEILKELINDSANWLIKEGLAELDSLNDYLSSFDILDSVRFNPFLARGLEIYTGTVYEVFLTDGSISSSLASGGRYDKIIGGFLNSSQEYPAVGVSFGLDAIYTALLKQNKKTFGLSRRCLIIPMNTNNQAIRIAQELRADGIRVEIEMIGRKLKKALDYANKEGIPFVIIVGEDEVKNDTVVVRDMSLGCEKVIKQDCLLAELNLLIRGTIHVAIRE